MSMNRRAFLSALAASAALPSVSLARVETDTRLVVVLLRGGLDGLGMVPATADPHFRSARGAAAPTHDGLALDGPFALHPAMAPLMPLWERHELLVAHAIGLPYQQRSHFDAQDVLETGHARPMAFGSGWLSRALHAAALPQPALGVGAHVPLLLRGPARATSVDPGRRSLLSADRLAAVRAVLADDPLLSSAIDEGLATRALVDSVTVRRSRDMDAQAATVARLLALPEGPRVAVFDVGGWDTHTGQERVLERQLGQLAEGLVAFAEADPAVWQKTMVVCVTEFGRTVAGNGTGVTDHGTGGAALVLGGAIRGRRVLTDWPGLRPQDLLEGRDLRPTLDVRGLLKGVLQAQLGLSERVLAREVFPDSQDVPILEVV